MRRLIEAAHDEAWNVLVENRDVLDDLVLKLFEKETLGGKELLEIFANVRKSPERPVWLSSERRPISDLPPIQTPNEVQGGQQRPRRCRTTASTRRPPWSRCPRAAPSTRASDAPGHQRDRPAASRGRRA